MVEDEKKGWRKFLENIFVFELAFYLFDLFTRVVHEFFKLLLILVFVVMILMAVMHFLK